MVGFNVQFFFDRAAVTAAMSVANRNALSKAGAFVRTRARSSIRTRKRVSAPGQPPSSHTGLLKQFIQFYYDPSSTSVVIGPAKLNKVGAAPQSLEFGGESTIVERGVQRQITVKARPYMGPALLAETELGNVAGAWADTFGR